LGGNHGETLIDIAHKFRKVYVFECNPITLELLRNRVRYFQNIQLFPFAASNNFGTSIISIPNNGNFLGSATIAGFSEHSQAHSVAEFEVTSVDLGQFLDMLGVTCIDLYVSDIEGHDFIALQSMKSFITKGLIKRIQVEVWNDAKPIPFSNENLKCQERFFEEYLSSNYSKIAEGISNTDSLNWAIASDWNWKDVLWEIKNTKTNHS
jgi:FkbM family methyltransferase